MEDDIKFIDGENFKNKRAEGLSFKQIVMNQLSRVTQLMSKEFHGGYYNETIKIIEGVPITSKTYNEDTREQYKNAVNCLHDLLIAKFDTTAKTEMKKFETDKSIFIDSINKSRTENKIDDDTAKNRIAQYHRNLLQLLIKLLDRLDYLGDEAYEE